VPIDESLPPRRTDRNYLILVAIVTAIGAGLVWYSQTMAFAYDEGFHLLTAQLIKAGKRPYIDFFFPQAALNAYWNAGLMSLFGESWRGPHAAAAVLTWGATLLTMDFVYFRCPAPSWRFSAGLATAFIVGANAQTVEFGTIAQAYASATFLVVAAFRCAPPSIFSRNAWWAFLLGLLSVAAAGCTLLAAPAAPVAALWMLWCNRAGNRWLKLVAFGAGGVLASTPLLLLYLQSPREVAFNVIDFHLRYREVEWAGALQHNFEVTTSWMLSPQALLLGLLTLTGLWFVRYRSGWDRAKRAEFYLCAWLILAFTVHITRASPTFERYYILCVPFMAILGAMGLYSIGTRLSSRRLVTAVVVLVTAFAIGRRLYDEREDTSWMTYEKIAKKVKEVTPVGAPLVAEEMVYFLAQRTPPSGLEHSDAHKLEQISPELAARLHIMPQSALDKLIKSGAYAVVETCKDEAKISDLELGKLYRQKEAFDDCTVFWDRAPK